MHYDPDGNPVTLAEWRRLFETVDRSVGQAELDVGGRPVVIVTAWLGLNHNFANPEGPPLIFETMIHGGPMDGVVTHYSTKEQALAGHRKVLKQHRFWRVLRMLRSWRLIKATLQMLKLWMTRPPNVRINRIFLWFWSLATLLALATVVTNVFFTYRWFLTPFHLTTLFVDVTALRWTFMGYRWARKKRREEAARVKQENEFERIVKEEFRD